jgi:hypothetical protein
VTKLQLNSNSLSGTLPASLSSCTALRDLEVQNNFLSGEVAYRHGHINNTRHMISTSDDVI